MTATQRSIVGKRRTAWMTARARNATRRVWLVVSVGLFAALLSTLVLVLAPRQADRALQAQLDALPPIIDTVVLHSNIDSARTQHQQAEQRLASIRALIASEMKTPVVSGAPPAPATLPAVSADSSSGRQELAERVARSRAAPLLENYRALADAALLRDDARVRALLDTLNEVNREREAFAALGGPDARYAALTARLSALGQRLLQLADLKLGATAVVTAETAPVRVAAPVASNNEAARVAHEAVQALSASLTTSEQALERARKQNNEVSRRAAQIREGASSQVPPVAMIIAALVLGLVVGYGVAFGVEVWRPQIADVAEVERITDARVHVHHGATRATMQMRLRRTDDSDLPPVLDGGSETWQLLHLSLTGLGDAVKAIRVVGDTSALTATVGINLAAAAARDARAALLIDGDLQARMAAGLLRVKAHSGITDASAKPKSLPAIVTRVHVGREHFINAVFGGKRAQEKTVNRAVLQREMQRLADAHDLTVLLSSPSGSDGSEAVMPTTDVILCARLGHTRLDWLTRCTGHLLANKIRLRAVLLWAHDAPQLA